MNEWTEGIFEVWSPDGSRTVSGVISGAFGIHFDTDRDPPGWVVAHIGTGMSIGGWQPFKSGDIAKEFVARIRPLADWNSIDAEAPPDVTFEVNLIVDELICDNPPNSPGLAPIPPYIGDDAFKSFLEEHGCPTGFEEIRMRFLGAMVRPGRDADIHPLVEDFFECDMPEFSDGSELEAFLHRFLGLWNEVAESSQHNPITLSPVGTITTHEEIKDLLFRRLDEVVFGFLEGVWGREDELPLTEARAATLTAIEEAVRTYDERLSEIARKDGAATEKSVADLLREITEVDKAIEATITSLVEAFRNDPSTDHPKMKRAKALIDELAFAEGLPRETIGQCIARREEMVPIFLDTLRDYVEARHAIDDREGALFFIIHILGELGERRAFAPLMELLDGEPERVEAVLGEAITENLTQLLISVFDGDTDRLYRVMNNPDADEFVRSGVFETWTYLVAAGHIDRLEAEQYLSSCFGTLKPQEKHYIWAAWVEAVAHLGLAGLTGQVRNAFDLDRIPTMTILFEEFEEILEAASQTDDPVAFVEMEGMKPFTDTIGVLSQWYGFSEEYLRKERKAEHAERQPIQKTSTISNPYRTVGRNDPCPCGSGKKYKKCCLH